MMLAGWAVICAVASGTNIILIVIINPDIQYIAVPGPSAILVILAIVFAFFAVIFMLSLYETSRQLERFDEYKADLERQWGPMDED